jgi:hypothetical protein
MLFEPQSAALFNLKLFAVDYQRLTPVLEEKEIFIHPTPLPCPPFPGRYRKHAAAKQAALDKSQSKQGQCYWSNKQCSALDFIQLGGFGLSLSTSPP